MSIQDDIITSVLEHVIDEELKSSSWFKNSSGYYQINGDDELYTAEEFIRKLFEVAEEKFLH